MNAMWSASCSIKKKKSEMGRNFPRVPGWFLQRYVALLLFSTMDRFPLPSPGIQQPKWEATMVAFICYLRCSEMLLHTGRDMVHWPTSYSRDLAKLESDQSNRSSNRGSTDPTFLQLYWKWLYSRFDSATYSFDQTTFSWIPGDSRRDSYTSSLGKDEACQHESYK